MPRHFERARVSRPSPAPLRTVGDAFAATVAAQPHALALIDGQTFLTFTDLDGRVAELCRSLSAAGIGVGDVVAYQLPNWWEAVVVFLASAHLGAIVNPLLPSFRESELRFTLRQSGARVLFIPAVFRGCDHRDLIATIRDDLPDLEEIVVCRSSNENQRAGRRELFPGLAAPTWQETPPPHHDADALLLLMYTSGTTSLPKGVLHTHATLVAEIESLARVHSLGPGDCCLMPSPLTHISGVIHAILAPAILGTRAVLVDRWEPAVALRQIASEFVTYMVGAPTFLQDLIPEARARYRDTTSFRLFSCGGAAVTPDLVRQARETFPTCVAKRVYGSTEFPTISTTGPEDALTHGIETEGRAIAPVEIRIVGEDGRPCAAGEEGEVQARGPECFVGYADASLNEESFTADGWFRSGDLGALDAAGYLRITGRIKEIVVRKGEKISLREVEEAVAAHPAVAEVAVVPLPDAETGERACAVVVLRPAAALGLDELGLFLTCAGLARHKHPERLEIVDALPRTASGKIAKAGLAAVLVREPR